MGLEIGFLITETNKFIVNWTIFGEMVFRLMSGISAEDFILAQAVKTERTAIPVNITVAVEAGRIDPNEYLEDGLRDLEESYKNDTVQGKNDYNMARKEEKLAKQKMKRREGLKNGTIKATKQSDKGQF